MPDRGPEEIESKPIPTDGIERGDPGRPIEIEADVGNREPDGLSQHDQRGRSDGSPVSGPQEEPDRGQDRDRIPEPNDRHQDRSHPAR